jgi:hypothetical protein
MLQTFQKMKKKIASTQQSFSWNAWNDLWDIVTSQATNWKHSRILKALPSKVGQIRSVLQSGGTAKQHYNRSIVELSWLEEHGQCMDAIKVGPSKNPNAGRGAFANRFIPGGGLVAPAPLIHVPEVEVLKIYTPKESESKKEKAKGYVNPNLEGPSTFQLIMNYCFGHEQSTLLLCPYGLRTAYINHSSDRPNTKIQWSKGVRHPEWREWPIDKWGREQYSGLAFDFVALRDIEEDEEILMDYGEAWERAWQEHVHNFVPRENYVPAHERNEMVDVPYRTIEDRDYQSDGVRLWCRSWYLESHGYKKDQECRILKHLTEDRHVVQIMKYQDRAKDGVNTMEAKKVLVDIPSDAFYFKDVQYSRDHLQFDAFRHAMMIPNDIFPTAWKTNRVVVVTK